MRVAVVHNRDKSGVISVFGPQNRERYNPQTVERVASALEKGGHTVRVLDGNMHIVEQLRDFMPRVVSGERPGMVFNMAYGIQGVSRYTHLPAMLEMLGVPYVGSNPMAHGLALDKVVAKIVFKNAGLPTPNFWNFSGPDDWFDDIQFPVIVKPKMEAVSYGIQVVENDDDLREAVRFLIREFGQHVLVEEFIPGREFAVGLLGNGDPEVLPIVEIDLGGDPEAIQTASDKLKHPRGKICPPELEEEKSDQLKALAKRAFRSLDLFDFARVDVRMDAEGNFYILEINSMASLGLTGAYIYAAKTAGYSYEDLINRILDVAAARYFGVEYLRPEQDTDAGRTKSFTAKVRSYMRSQSTTLEDLLAKMVSWKTSPGEVEHVNWLGEMLAAQLSRLGFQQELFPQTEVGHVRYFKNHQEDRNDVLLLGQLDSPENSDGSAELRIDGNRLYGAGLAENKGGLAVALGALRGLRFARRLRKLKCGILVTTDASENGAHGRTAVRDLTALSKYVIGLKPGDLEGSVVTSRSGRGTYRVEISASRSKARARDAEALALLHRSIRRMRKIEEDNSEVRIGVRNLQFDCPFDAAPVTAHAKITVRFNNPDDAEKIDRHLRSVSKLRSKSRLKVSVTGRTIRPPMVQTDGDGRLYEELSRLSSRLHQPVQGSHRWHSADICWADPEVAKLDGMGPMGMVERGGEEYILRSSLVDRAVVLALLLDQCQKSLSASSGF